MVQQSFDISKIWIEVLIVLMVALSVFGGALLASQDQPGSRYSSGDFTTGFARTPLPATPTPTLAVTRGLAVDIPLSPPSVSPLASMWPATPTVVGWVE